MRRIITMVCATVYKRLLHFTKFKEEIKMLSDKYLLCTQYSDFSLVNPIFINVLVYSF